MRSKLRQLFAPRDENLEAEIQRTESFALAEMAETEEAITEVTTHCRSRKQPVRLVPSIPHGPRRAHR